MSKPNPVNWFEIPTNDLDRATKFYETVFGTELSPMDKGPMKMAFFPMPEDMASSPGATGALVQGEHYTPSHQGTVVYFSVESIEATLAKIESNGGKTINPKMSIGEFGFIAHFSDCEGNSVALHSRT